MSWQSAQNRITVPARAGPSQYCRPATHMFPEGCTTRPNSMGPRCQRAGGGGGPPGAVGCAGPLAPLARVSVGGSHNSIRSR
jgi:hypothetical protein